MYNGLQTSLRKRFSNRYSWDLNYTLGKSEATQGGDLSAYYIASFENNQDFWDPEYDRGPSSNDIRHRLNASFIYELPAFSHGAANAVLGGWQISGILQTRSGNALLVGAPGYRQGDFTSGAAYVYRRTGDDWTLEAKLLS